MTTDQLLMIGVIACAVADIGLITSHALALIEQQRLQKELQQLQQWKQQLEIELVSGKLRG